MFKNRSIQVKMVKDSETPAYDVTVGDSLDAINQLIAENVKPIASAVAMVIGAKTFSEIAIHIAKTYIK